MEFIANLSNAAYLCLQNHLFPAKIYKTPNIQASTNQAAYINDKKARTNELTKCLIGLENEYLKKMTYNFKILKNFANLNRQLLKILTFLS